MSRHMTPQSEIDRLMGEFFGPAFDAAHKLVLSQIPMPIAPCDGRTEALNKPREEAL